MTENKKVKKTSMNIHEIKKLAKNSNKTVDDFLALNKANDPFYIQQNSIEKAKWFYEVWKNEGSPEIHPRGFHYQIMGTGYKIKIQGKETEYENTEQCWNYLEKGAKYSRLLGLVPYDKIKDEQNPKPENVQVYLEHSEFKPKDTYVYDDVYGMRFNPRLEHDTTESFISKSIDDILEDLFENVNYYPENEQPNYFEIWAEKSGVIPYEVAEEFNATIRPAGSGEFSLRMCYHAVNKAKEENKNLHIFVLSDFDPKGRDMPKSVARKIEKIAREFEVKAYVHHVLLTKEQCIKYSLPTVPAKKPKSNNIGAKSYKTHTNIFKKFAGQDPTELNSFLAREPEAYKKTIREAIKPYFDEDLANKFRESENKLRINIKRILKRKFRDLFEELSEIRTNLKEKLSELGNDLKPVIKKRVKELGIKEIINEFKDLLYFDVSELIKNERFQFPKVNVQIPLDTLLDTTRSYIEQIEKYKEFDIR